VANEDQEAAAKVNETIELWTKMWMADSDRYNEMRTQLENMQTNCEACVLELMESLERLMQTMTTQTDSFLGNAVTMANQSRNAIKEERKAVLTRLDALQRDIENLSLHNSQLVTQVKGLQKDRRELQGQMDQMVHRSELNAVQHEAGATASGLQALEKECSRQRELADALNSRLGDLQAEKNKLLATIQVSPYSTHHLSAFRLKNMLRSAPSSMFDGLTCAGAGHGAPYGAGGRQVGSARDAPDVAAHSRENAFTDEAPSVSTYERRHG
jgi:chromosome segregation ATPase